jgi:hypothetical protein
VTDGVLRKVIHKWLKAGVMEGGAVTYPEAGTPQGGVISPLLANIHALYARSETPWTAKRTSDLEEPGAAILHARICGGPRGISPWGYPSEEPSPQRPQRGRGAGVRVRRFPSPCPLPEGDLRERVKVLLAAFLVA